MDKIIARGRIAPSPTGRMHLGNAFAFLMAFCSIKSKGGSLVLRIEDIDPDRSRFEFEQSIIEDLTWLGISYDEGPLLHGAFSPYRQSERRSHYEKALYTLEKKGVTYPCFCTRNELKMLASAPHNEDGSIQYPGTCRKLSKADQYYFITSGKKSCIRLDVEKAISFLQAFPINSFLEKNIFQLSVLSAVLGNCSEHFSANAAYSNNHIFPSIISSVPGGDFALMRSDGVFAYQLAVVVDDMDMKITEVVRGNDLEESTPRQKLLYFLLGGVPPLFYHFPLLCDHNGDRLAKRHNSLTLGSLREQGIAPEMLIGYLGFVSGLLDTNTPMSSLELTKYWNWDKVKQGTIHLPENLIQEISK